MNRNCDIIKTQLQRNITLHLTRKVDSSYHRYFFLHDSLTDPARPVHGPVIPVSGFFPNQAMGTSLVRAGLVLHGLLAGLVVSSCGLGWLVCG